MIMTVEDLFFELIIMTMRILVFAAEYFSHKANDVIFTEILIYRHCHVKISILILNYVQVK